ncbi:MAG: PTS fructose transporter subunit IIA [Pseudomonadota bacterium]
MSSAKTPQIGLVIVAHGGLAEALQAATEHVVGPQSGMRSIAIGPNDDLRQCQNRIESAVAEVRQGAGVIVVTDMFGGTPSNLAHGVMSEPGVEVIYGANLPMLVKLAKMRDRGLEEAVRSGLDAGRKYVNSANSILSAEGAA